MVITATPNPLHYLKGQSFRRYGSGMFAKQKPHSGSSGRHEDSTQHTGNQRGFVPLTDNSNMSNAWAGKADVQEMEKGYEFETGMEMHGVRDTGSGIH
ncbi:MAG: hypothetical protein LQ350_007211, partial [Teloschistes chrysophthalmus]